MLAGPRLQATEGHFPSDRRPADRHGCLLTASRPAGSCEATLPPAAAAATPGRNLPAALPVSATYAIGPAITANSASSSSSWEPAGRGAKRCASSGAPMFLPGTRCFAINCVAWFQ